MIGGGGGGIVDVDKLSYGVVIPCHVMPCHAMPYHVEEGGRGECRVPYISINIFVRAILRSCRIQVCVCIFCVCVSASVLPINHTGITHQSINQPDTSVEERERIYFFM